MADSSWWQDTEDWHAAGEPFRIVEHLPPNSLDPGLSVAEQRDRIRRTENHPLESLRQSLALEPRGHADMYGGYILPADDAGAHFGALFWHTDGFPTACGHGTIVLGYWALAHGLVQTREEGVTDVVIDVPSGWVVARATCSEGVVKHVDFKNIPCYQIAKAMPLKIATAGVSIDVQADLVFAGVIHAYIDVAQMGLSVEKHHAKRFVEAQRCVKQLLSDYTHEGHNVYGVCFYQMLDESEAEIVEKNVMVFAHGQIDRSPCGSGTAGRLAISRREQDGSFENAGELLHHWHEILGFSRRDRSKSKRISGCHKSS